MSNWIKWCKGLARKREVMVMACETGMSPREVAGTLMEIWEWADDNTEDGNVASVTSALLGVTLGVTPEFIEAFKMSTWLIESSDGIEFPNYMRHNAQTAKNRLLAAERQKRKRDKGNGKSNDENVTPPLPDLIGSDLTGSKKKGKKGNTPPIQDPQFETFWQGVPNKLGKGKARAAWAKAIKTTPPETILAGLPKYQEYERRRMSDEGYRPLHPTTWINGERWEDELESRPGPRLPGASEPAMSQCELCRKPYPMGGDPVCDCRMCPCCKRLREARFFDGGHDDCEICRNPRGA